MFYKKLKDRINELETKLKAEQELNDDASKNIQNISKSLDDSMKIASDLRNDLEKVNTELDIYKREREELKNKCEEHVDKDSLITLLTMKNHDMELKIIELNRRLEELYKAQIQIMSIQQHYPWMPGTIMYPYR